MLPELTWKLCIGIWLVGLTLTDDLMDSLTDRQTNRQRQTDRDYDFLPCSSTPLDSRGDKRIIACVVFVYPVADLGATSVFPCPWTSDWTAIHGLPSLFVILEVDCSMHVAWDPLPLLARTHHASRLLERRRLEADEWRTLSV